MLSERAHSWIHEETVVENSGSMSDILTGTGTGSKMHFNNTRLEETSQLANVSSDGHGSMETARHSNNDQTRPDFEEAIHSTPIDMTPVEDIPPSHTELMERHQCAFCKKVGYIGRHLRESTDCCRQYSKALNLFTENNPVPILNYLKVCAAENCPVEFDSSGPNLKQHIASSAPCFQWYQQFGATIDEISNVLNHNRKLMVQRIKRKTTDREEENRKKIENRSLKKKDQWIENYHKKMDEALKSACCLCLRYQHEYQVKSSTSIDILELKYHGLNSSCASGVPYLCEDCVKYIRNFQLPRKSQIKNLVDVKKKNRRHI